MAIIVIIILAVIISIFMIYKYNELITRKNKVKNSWANIEAQMQRRFDLIPNLVEIVNAFASQEIQALESVTEARSGYLSAHNEHEKIEMNEQLTSNLKSLYVVVENYPELKSNTNFLKLQGALSEIEEDLSYARQFYNDAVTIYNNKIMLFPGNIIASMFNFEKEELFDAVDAAGIAPKIEFKIKRKPKYRKCPVCGASVAENEADCKYCGCSLV